MRPFPPPARSARSCTLNGPVIDQSFGVSPSPSPFCGSLLEIPVTAHTGAGPRLSLARTVSAIGTIRWSDGQSDAALGVTRVMTGATVSVTVTVKLPADEWPALSVAVQVTVDVPIGNAEPEAGAQKTEATPLAGSTAVAAG